MEPPSTRQPDWTIRVAGAAAMVVIVVFVGLAVHLRHGSRPPARPAFSYAVVAEDTSKQTGLHRMHVVVPPGVTRAQLTHLRDYLDYQHRGERTLTFVFYDDRATALRQFDPAHSAQPGWERHLLAQFLRGPMTRWFGRPSEHGFDRWE